MKKTPCEIIVWEVLPCIRKGLAEHLLKYGLSQKEIAERIGVSNAAISQYLSNKRGKITSFDDFLKKEIEKSAEKIFKGADAIDEICRICSIIKEKIDFRRKGVC